VPQLATSWSAQQLTEFLAQVSSCADEASAIRVAIERAAEAIDAEAGAVVLEGEVVASIGFTKDDTPDDELIAAAGRAIDVVGVPGVGRCPVLTAPLEETSDALVLARLDDDGFSAEEAILVRGMARVLSLTRELLRGLDEERALREQSERQAAENVRLLESLEERQALLERLSRIQRSIVHRAALNEVLDAIVAGARELLRDDVAAVRLIDPEDPTIMEMVASSGVSVELIKTSRRSPVGKGAGGIAISGGRLVIIEDYESSPDGMLQFAAERLQAAMAAPVRQNGEVVGSLLVASYEAGRRYSELEQEVLAAFAEHTSLALTDAKNFDDALHRAFHDALTERPNRPLFLDRLEHALARSPRSDSGVAVLFLDIDRFKGVNDRHGHAGGDEALRAVAALLRGAVRAGDLIARPGGDELAVLLVGALWSMRGVLAGRLTLLDALVLIGLYAVYLRRTIHSGGEAPEPEGVAAALAALTRNVGVVLAPALAVEALHQWRDDGRSPIRGLASALGPAVGVGLYLLYWNARIGDALAPIHQQANWQRSFSWPWMTLFHATRDAIEYVGIPDGGYWAIDWLIVVPVLGASVYAAVRYRPSYAIYLWGGLLIPLLYVFPSRPLMSMPRFVLPLFPAFWAIAEIAERWRIPASTVVAVSAVGLGCLVVLFVNWYYIF